jgi:hypothetical protein
LSNLFEETLKVIMHCLTQCIQLILEGVLRQNPLA